MAWRGRSSCSASPRQIRLSTRTSIPKVRDPGIKRLCYRTFGAIVTLPPGISLGEGGFPIWEGVRQCVVTPSGQDATASWVAGTRPVEGPGPASEAPDGDALVPRTEYPATGTIAVTIDGASADCRFGVIRQGGADARSRSIRQVARSTISISRAHLLPAPMPVALLLS